MKICLYNINFLPFDDYERLWLSRSIFCLSFSFSSLFFHSSPLFTIFSSSTYYRIITQIYIFLHALRALEVFSGIFFARSNALCPTLSVSHASLTHTETAPRLSPQPFSSFCLHSHFVWKSFSDSLFSLSSCCFALPNSKHSFFFLSLSLVLCVEKHTRAFAFVVCHLAQHSNTGLAWLDYIHIQKRFQWKL